MTPFDSPYFPIAEAKAGQSFAREMPVRHTIPHILLAEENSSLQQLFTQMLELAGFRVTVYSGKQEEFVGWIDTSAMLSEDVPMCLLLDVSFVSTNATEFLHCIRTQWRQVIGKVPPIIVLTTNRAVAEELTPHVLVILKPFHMRDLLALIRG
jgi:DNA-binding response OmpR family regulator